MRNTQGHERDPEELDIRFSETITHKEQGSGGLAFQTKDIPLTTSVIQRRTASHAIPHERVSGAS
jgi:hypothetical protein